MITNKKLFPRWQGITKCVNARNVRAISNVVARHVSAKGLDLLKTPLLSKHHLLSANDKNLWDAAYEEEYRGLERLGTWETITEDEYTLLRKEIGHALPTMAISTIKYDGYGNPVRCKYRIVALGNLDPTNWSKSDCFAPVLSTLECRFLTSLSARLGCIPKTGDVSQAFCQSHLPQSEQYVVRPPPAAL